MRGAAGGKVAPAVGPRWGEPGMAAPAPSLSSLSRPAAGPSGLPGALPPPGALPVSLQGAVLSPSPRQAAPRLLEMRLFACFWPQCGGAGVQGGIWRGELRVQGRGKWDRDSGRGSWDPAPCPRFCCKQPWERGKWQIMVHAWIRFAIYPHSGVQVAILLGED